MDRYSECPECYGEGIPLGALGAKMWVRCRDCGWVYYVEEPNENPPDGR
jgi:rubredoxin